jgi:hypothetical protein
MSVGVETAAPTPYEAFFRALRSRGPTLNLLFEQARVSPEREGDTIVRDAFASAIVTVLHDMLRDYWSSIGGTKNEWKRAGLPLNGYSVAQVLAAALDNSRYFEEWDREKMPALLRRRSVKTLCALLGIQYKKPSKNRPFCGNVCWAVLETLAGGAGYGGIEASVREFAQQLENLRAG